jgi:hypothetical protein
MGEDPQRWPADAFLSAVPWFPPAPGGPVALGVEAMAGRQLEKYKEVRDAVPAMEREVRVFASAGRGQPESMYPVAIEVMYANVIADLPHRFHDLVAGTGFPVGDIVRSVCALHGRWAAVFPDGRELRGMDFQARFGSDEWLAVLESLRDPCRSPTGRVVWREFVGSAFAGVTKDGIRLADVGEIAGLTLRQVKRSFSRAVNWAGRSLGAVTDHQLATRRFRHEAGVRAVQWAGGLILLALHGLGGDERNARIAVAMLRFLVSNEERLPPASYVEKYLGPEPPSISQIQRLMGVVERAPGLGIFAGAKRPAGARLYNDVQEAESGSDDEGAGDEGDADDELESEEGLE